jgi:hypothetical protein
MHTHCSADGDQYDKNGPYRFVEKMPGVYSAQALQDVKMHPVQDCLARVMHYSYDHHHRTHHASYNSVCGIFPELQPSKHKMDCPEMGVKMELFVTSPGHLTLI